MLLHVLFLLLPSIASNERLGAASLASFSLRELQTSRGERRVARQAATSKMAEFTIFRVKKILNLSHQNWGLWKSNRLYLV
uniref:Putative secreted protein n=1 Tax=Ixodes ricinus TaxID=34613 RepID=A0A6B0U746_IXORI